MLPQTRLEVTLGGQGFGSGLVGSEPGEVYLVAS